MTYADDPLALIDPPGPGAERWAYVAYAVLAALTVGFAAAFGVEPAPMPHPAGPIGFAEVVAAALADAKRLPPEIAARTRYLSAAHLPAAERAELYAVVSYHANGISREVRRTKPRQVNAWLWAVVFEDYRWRRSVFEELKRANVYFALKVKAQDAKGKAADDFIPAPWLPAKETADLVALLNSATPIVRADQFLHQTAIQADRKGHGYYDFLDLTKRADAEALGGLDRQKAIDLYRELAAIVPVSGVTPNNRQVFRFATLTGGWWESRDVKSNADAKNAVSNLLDDYKHEAEEIVYTLPNGLPGYYLSDDKGVQQDTAPDTIAADHRSTNNDRRVHAAMSCVACHTDAGLKPIRDYARKIYNPETGLSLGALALDPATSRRLESVYLGPLAKAYARDTGDFGEAIEDVSGMKPGALAKAFERQWSKYLDEPVTLAKAAAEVGLMPAELQAKLREHARQKKLVDPVLAVYLADDPPPVRREHLEERFGLLMLITAGVGP